VHTVQPRAWSRMSSYAAELFMPHGGPGTWIQKLRRRSISGSMGSSQPRRTYGKLSDLPAGGSPARFSLSSIANVGTSLLRRHSLRSAQPIRLAWLICRPRGDSAGFVRCLDDTTLAIPDRRGNRRVDTFQNLRQNPGIGLILFVPGQRETLRVTGRAIVVRDRNIRNAMADHGQMPDLAMIVKVEKAFFHCGKSITRSKLWNSRL
jgi:predicted pyridoxine 5'-phosphate oxidase superfamily flavin-nucleotide-binding protein